MTLSRAVHEDRMDDRIVRPFHTAKFAVEVDGIGNPPVYLLASSRTMRAASGYHRVGDIPATLA